MNVHSQQIPQKAEGNPHHLYSGDVRSTTCTARLFYHKIVIFYSGSHHLKIRGIFVFKIRVACDCKWVDKCDFDFDATWQAGMAVRAADPRPRVQVPQQQTCLSCLRKPKSLPQTCCEATIPWLYYKSSMFRPMYVIYAGATVCLYSSRDIVISFLPQHPSGERCFFFLL